MAPLCHLRAILGETEECSGERCSFWEDDGCAIERLGLQGADPDTAAFLLELRERLEGVNAHEAAEMRTEFARRLGDE
jgi:hypothetical protein